MQTSEDHFYVSFLSVYICLCYFQWNSAWKTERGSVLTGEDAYYSMIFKDTLVISVMLIINSK